MTWSLTYLLFYLGDVLIFRSFVNMVIHKVMFFNPSWSVKCEG